MKRKIPLSGMTLTELKDVAAQTGMPSYSAAQMADWLYKKRIPAIAEMTNLPAAKRALLEETYETGLYAPEDSVRSSDGTVKYLFRTQSGHSVETVCIPSDERLTLCVSSQAGCRMKCLFCMTGKQGFNAQLTAHEIFNQIHAVPESNLLTNIVFMGMGEPFDNADEVFKVLEILTSPYGYGWSPKRITVSTIGHTKGLRRFLEESSCHLAVSIHSPYPNERQSLMPMEKVYPIAETIRLLRQYDFSHQQRLSFEYILFEKKNDSLQHAKALAGLLKGISCRVNLICYHAIPGVPLKICSLQTMENFRNALNDMGIISTIRTSRGEDILAACGMLSGKNREKRSNE